MMCDFMSFSTVFHSYQNDGWVIMMAVLNVIPFRVGKNYAPAASLAGQGLNHKSIQTALDIKYISFCSGKAVSQH